MLIEAVDFPGAGATGGIATFGTPDVVDWPIGIPERLIGVPELVFERPGEAFPGTAGTAAAELGFG